MFGQKSPLEMIEEKIRVRFPENFSRQAMNLKLKDMDQRQNYYVLRHHDNCFAVQTLSNMKEENV